jgi:hypothetical protein
MPGAKARPFGCRLLHAILAELALAGGNQRLDLIGPPPLGDGDQRDLLRLAASGLARIGNAGANFSQA